MNNSTLKKTPQFGLNYTWINFVVCILILTTWIGCKKESEVTSSNSPQKPNVVLILTDDQGWGDFAYTGNTNVSTPNIDALAESGTSFENFYVQPVCSPTRAELLTGRYYPRTGVYSTSAGGERINLDETLLQTYLKKRVIIPPLTANGTTGCSRLTIPIRGDLMIFTVLLRVTGAIISAQCWSIMGRLLKAMVIYRTI